eukprot:gene20625-26438_t
MAAIPAARRDMPEALKQQKSRSTRRLAAALMLSLATAGIAAPVTPAAEPKLPIPAEPSMFTGLLKAYKDCRV